MEKFKNEDELKSIKEDLRAIPDPKFRDGSFRKKNEERYCIVCARFISEQSSLKKLQMTLSY